MAGSYRLATDVIRSRAQGKLYDPERATLFGVVQALLAAEQFTELPKPAPKEIENRAFCEACVSNFIEGTKFSVQETRVIQFRANQPHA